jgi:hypothetical protein
MRLPALILPPRPGQGDVVVALTGHEPVTRTIRALAPVDLGEQGFVCQPMRHRPHGRDRLVRCPSRFDLGDEVRGCGVTRFGQMDCRPPPVLAPFFAGADSQIVGRGDPQRRGWNVLMVAPADLPMVIVVLLDPLLA